MKGKVTFLVVLIVVFISSLETVNAGDRVRKYSNYDESLISTVLYEFDFDYSNIKEKVQNVDFVFVGKIKSKVGSYKFKGNDPDQMPVTKFNVEVVEEIKGEVGKKQVTISYFGGEQDGMLYVANMSAKSDYEIVPLKGEYYLISANQIQKDNGRLKKGEVAIWSEYSLLHIESRNSILENSVISLHRDAFTQEDETGQIETYETTMYMNGSCLNDCYDLSWVLDSVSFGKIYYQIDSSFAVPIVYSINKWNQLGEIEILPDTSSTINTLVFKDVNNTSSGSWVALYQYSPLFEDSIKFNKYYFSGDGIRPAGMNTDERRKTVMHEIGHSLGLYEFRHTSNSAISVSESDSNVMLNGVRELSELGQCDKEVYHWLWG